MRGTYIILSSLLLQQQNHGKKARISDSQPSQKCLRQHCFSACPSDWFIRCISTVLLCLEVTAHLRSVRGWMLFTCTETRALVHQGFPGLHNTSRPLTWPPTTILCKRPQSRGPQKNPPKCTKVPGVLAVSEFQSAGQKARNHRMAEVGRCPWSRL